MNAWVRGLSDGWRRATRSPAYGLLVVGTLGLALFTLASMFAVVDAVLLRPLTYRDPGRLVALWEASPADGREKSRIAAADFLDLKAQRQLFEAAALYGSAGASLLSGGEPQQLFGARVEPDYFRVLGVQPLLGRAFGSADAQPGAPRVVILGHGLFQRRFGGHEELLGQSIVLDGNPCTVVGVMPPGLYPTWPLDDVGISFLPEHQQYWVPLSLDNGWRTNRRTHVFGAVARLRSGVTRERAGREVAGLARRLAGEFPATNRGLDLRLVPLTEELVGSSRRLLWLLLLAAALIVALAAANVAGLALSRAVTRRYETAVRVSLGAARSTQALEACAEAFALACVGAGGGLFLARAGLPLLTRLLPLEIPRLQDARVDWRVALVTLAAAALCAAAVGLAQAYGAAATRPEEVLRSGASGARNPTGHRSGLHRFLVIAQVAVSVVLLSLAGLFARSLLALTRVESGLSSTGVLTAGLDLPSSGYRDWDRIVEFQRALTARLAERPAVRAAAVAYDSPLASSWLDAFTLLDGGRADDAAGAVSAQLNIVSPAFLRAAGIRLRSGRPFADGDDRHHPGATLVSESFARQHYPAGDALGHRLRALTPSRMWTGVAAPTEFRIVGVVGDVRNQHLDHPAAPTVYLPSAQFPQQEMTVIVRLGGDPLAFVAELRHVVAGLDPTLPIQRVETLQDAVDRQMARPRFALVLVGAFGGGALLLAALGVYGLLTLVIGYRTREIAVRLAVGARRADVARQVIGQACRLTALGAAWGILGALGAGRAVHGLLYGAAPDDPLVVATTVLLLFGTALLAAAWPTRRATRVDPAQVLRS